MPPQQQQQQQEQFSWVSAIFRVVLIYLCLSYINPFGGTKTDPEPTVTNTDMDNIELIDAEVDPSVRSPPNGKFYNIIKKGQPMVIFVFSFILC